MAGFSGKPTLLPDPDVRRSLIAMSATFRGAFCIALLLALGSCSPPDMDIIVSRQSGELAIAKPWSFWNVIGLDSRDYCIRRIEMFDADTLLSAVDLTDNQCLRLSLPIPFSSFGKFPSKKNQGLAVGHPYGVGITGIGNGRVDFVLNPDRTITNITDRQRQMKGPCGSYFGSC
jgi:hypothetical protein